ncbi:MAG: protein kinase, partial [Gemmatimonadales bacterium]|nr:protein kinase [Gemmatimonadales bacterium]NIN10159.1 protein kinase [Gemmatimonadales bacterium]NIN48826.1 protein kinase [Gemmatimonadales bacterium]NIP06290.1 protein kinase [Gemmatimonadales bacterium]NIR01426.1 protein kinase [Gemmatimonadales bacterium]
MPEQLERLKTALADSYAIERELGAGGMATVYLARDLKHDRLVAVKVFRPELAASMGVERFLREIQITAKLSHPHILPLYDSGEADGFLYYVMPYVEGESLHDLMAREKQLPIHDAIRITKEVAEALGQAHSYGLVHRDIKPQNILLSGGHAVVADFGISRAVSVAGGEKLTQTGMAVGTPAYMSPEQAAGDENLDGRSDLYSLGCVLYEMLVGQVPFTGPTPQSIMARHTMDTAPPPKIMRDTIPDDLEDVIYCALAKAPADRFRTATEFAEALEAVITGESPRLTKTGIARRPRRRAKSHRPLIYAAGAVLLVGGVFAGWQLLPRGPARDASAGGLDPTQVAVLYLNDLSADGELRHLADGFTEALISSLSQVRALNVISGNGVAPYRESALPPDSIARALRV